MKRVGAGEEEVGSGEMEMVLKMIPYQDNIVHDGKNNSSCLLCRNNELHGPSMLAVKAKIYGLLYKQYSSIAFDETSSYWSALKRS